MWKSLGGLSFEFSFVSTISKQLIGDLAISISKISVGSSFDKI